MNRLKAHARKDEKQLHASLTALAESLEKKESVTMEASIRLVYATFTDL